VLCSDRLGDGGGKPRPDCEARRIDIYTRLVADTAACEKRRNAEHARIKWMFTTEKARAKMGCAYPKPAAN
jgi:hypothetical protein